MKKAIFLILLVLLLSPRPFKASALEQNPDGAVSPRADGWRSSAGSDVPVPQDRGAVPPESSASQRIAPYNEGEDDIFWNNYEREMLSRRFFQKTLPPLKSKEKIIWSFKIARANLLL